ncbi:ribonuclease HII [Lactiplantibacillus mudanjiangensis]|uniref:Ribonuclease HII n=1 Tax=Lactiplantibacillus mudanjiangensis TaxID=1296538 RepID=A0A660E6N0_9LACO|nr:ribonuclease HII [Lactiplantibacillus mudanjiangensis]VDG24288.1 ribonuclease HII [Lactobacillus plantarum JDM1] [Lactiplantibacillus mudanjiangensis]VDG30449.1 ribonuclease HII [Lactobacillus plantarum JDM1] [Lactiplantibacillus mudanjiangensis]
MPERTIADFKALLTAQPTDEDLAAAQADPRKGVQQAYKQYLKRAEKQAALVARFNQHMHLERAFWSRGGQYVAGVDEVGRGPLAGPVVTAAVVLDNSFDLLEVNDSKQVTAKKRLALMPKILEEAVAVSIGVADAQTIDQLNIYEATRVAMKQAVEGLSVKPTLLLVDAMQIPVPIEQTRLIKGDAKSASISAASIVAKVVRDHLMEMYDQVYPGYDFADNMGYGTAKHLAGLKELGVTPIHRHSFSPVRDAE